MKMLRINRVRFTTILSGKIIKEAIAPLDSEERANVLIMDDSMFERNRSKKAELLAKVYDHVKHCYKFGFRLLTLGWSDGSTFLLVNSILLSTENKKNSINEAAAVDKRTVGYKRRELFMRKGTYAMPELLKQAKNTAIPVKYVLFDSWFSSPGSLHAVKEIGYDVIGMVKKTPRMFFQYNGEDMPLTSVCSKSRKRRGRSRYLLSVMVDVVKDGKTIPAKVVYVRNKNNRKEYLCLISTDVFTRYMMLSLESRESKDECSLGERFLYFSDEMSDITWIQAFQLLLQMFRTLFTDNTELSDEKIKELADTCMDTILLLLKSKLQAA